MTKREAALFLMIVGIAGLIFSDGIHHTGLFIGCAVMTLMALYLWRSANR